VYYRYGGENVNKKLLGIMVAFLMVLCTFQIAEPATAQPRSQFDPGNNQITGPQPSFLWRQIDQGQVRINNDKVKWATFRLRGSFDHVWINSTTFENNNDRLTDNNNRNNWNNWWSWNNFNNNNQNNRNRNNNIESSTITRLDKTNRINLRITRTTFDPQGHQTGNTQIRNIRTFQNAVGYYFTHRNQLVIPRNNGFR